MASEDDELWAAIAEPMRRRLLDVMLERGEATATALATSFPSPARPSPSTSRCSSARGSSPATGAGRELVYVVKPERLDAATAAMGRVAARWDQRLDRIKRISEERARRR
jgi:hypothetical protein